MARARDWSALPLVDVGPVVGGGPAAAVAAVAGQIQAACRDRGFFYVTGHGVPPDLIAELADASAEFFALPLADKLEIAMERGGRAWRGYSVEPADDYTANSLLAFAFAAAPSR